ncbi:inovirus Gp2 family protein [Pseudomonas sp. PDM25]|nr:inovirus Gp2 family protein [Pseudomonas sp. PDM25]
MDRYFHRVCYLGKAETKEYGQRCRAFGCSRGNEMLESYM